ncbi:hypothetical protein K435DRAFT_833733 [Dendrothele bispora CBS 962.96]|uniref:LsmAD domain-containing protein n=1 Tax=Dendrothele bispora (strain CBS 962.96) TaxID=1314807 RepID=A0A4S8MVV2_DENBC|nr:hypothetical protein K435DRAFT_833733 [Dendrothele bispora CBS 962.96]
MAFNNGTRSDASYTLGVLNGLTGVTVTISTKTSQRFEGVVASTNAEGDTTGVTLRDSKIYRTPYFIAVTNIKHWHSGPAYAGLTNGDSTFHTDTEISQKKSGGQIREHAPVATSQFAQGDDMTFGPSSGDTSWGQFDANARQFGVVATSDEDLYTTKLDRNAIDFKEKERKALKLAEEILNTITLELITKPPTETSFQLSKNSDQ